MNRRGLLVKSYPRRHLRVRNLRYSSCQLARSAKQAYHQRATAVGVNLEPIIDAASHSIYMVVTDAATYGVDVEIFELCAPILCKAPLNPKARCDSWPP